MITNLVATVIIEVVTNWTTISTTIPGKQPDVGYGNFGKGLESYTRIEKQEGTTQTNRYIRFEWKGTPYTTLVEYERGVKIGERDVTLSPTPCCQVNAVNLNGVDIKGL